MKIPEAFEAIMLLTEALGVEPINQFEECWEHGDMNKGWFIAANGNKQPRKCSAGVSVAPFTVYLQWNGFPAGVLTPIGGTIAAGSHANEDTLIAWLKEEASQARQHPEAR